MRRAAPAAVGLAAAVALAPLAALLIRAARELATLPSLLATALVTVALALAGSALCVALGGGLAWLAFRARLDARWDLAVLPAYLIPSFVAALGWLFALEPWHVHPYGPLGILLVWTATYAPLAYLLLRPALEHTIPRLALASWVHGVAGLRSARTLLPPLFAPLAAAGGSIYLAMLGNFGVPQILGAPVGTTTLATAAYARLLSPLRSDPLGDAAAVGLLLAVLSTPALLARAGSLEHGGAQPLPAAYAAPARGALLAFACIALGIPLFGLLREALTDPYSGALAPQFAAAFTYPQVRSGLVHSLVLAVLVTALLSLLAVVLVPSRAALRVLRRALDPDYLLPGTILGLGLIFILVRTPLYATPGILLVAYMLHFAAPALRAVEAGRDGVDRPVLAARVHGVTDLRAWLRIGLPLLRPYLAAGAFLIFPLAFSELTLSALLYAPGSETLGVAVLGQLNGGMYGPGAALGLVALAVALLALLLPRRTA